MYGPLIQGKLVRLRPPRAEDAEVMMTWFEDLEVTRFLKLQHPPSLEAEKEFLDKMARDADVVFWAVEHEGRIVGATGIVRIDWQLGSGQRPAFLLVKLPCLPGLGPRRWPAGCDVGRRGRSARC